MGFELTLYAPISGQISSVLKFGLQYALENFPLNYFRNFDIYYA
jgi:hypothetical protein